MLFHFESLTEYYWVGYSDAASYVNMSCVSSALTLSQPTLCENRQSRLPADLHYSA